MRLDYIDGIREIDMKKPVMWGIDNCRRLFVAIRKTSYHIDDGTLVDSDIVETFFQRYSNEGDVWTSGSRYSSITEIIQSKMEEKQYETFKNLILTGEAIHERCSLLTNNIVKYRLVCI